MTKAIYFDMDGTLADLYGVENWLYMLNNSIVKPYRDCIPLIAEKENFIAELLRLRADGYIIGIISWNCMDANEQYTKEVKEAKKKWLAKWFAGFEWDEIHIVKYGTPKHYVPKIRGGILFDDSAEVRKKWNRYGQKNNGCGYAFSEKNIIEQLRSL